jgi:UDP-glucose/GDP-mannose dehydrogenase family, NAD binding domain
VLTACAGLPLAIAIAGARLTARTNWTVRRSPTGYPTNAASWTGSRPFTTSYREVAEFGDVHFLCVDTPEAAHGAADLQYVTVGTARKLLQRIGATGPPGGRPISPGTRSSPAKAILCTNTPASRPLRFSA